jgi:hypothetical protein
MIIGDVLQPLRRGAFRPAGQTKINPLYKIT